MPAREHRQAATQMLSKWESPGGGGGIPNDATETQVGKGATSKCSTNILQVLGPWMEWALLRLHRTFPTFLAFTSILYH